MVGSIGGAIAAKALGLTLSPVGGPIDDLWRRSDQDDRRNQTAISAAHKRLVALRIASSTEAKIVYEPRRAGVEAAGKMRKNEQRVANLLQLVRPPEISRPDRYTNERLFE